jgi:hypothetical protein
MEHPGAEEHPRLIRSTTRTAVQCRCGTRVREGGNVVGVAPLPPPVEAVLAEAVFCSEPCLRASFLEVLETLDALDTPTSATVVKDLRETYRALAAMFISVMAD